MSAPPQKGPCGGQFPRFRQFTQDQHSAVVLGLQPGSGINAHHIVESTGSRAQPARDILDHFQIDINSAANGVPLRPTGPRPAHHGQGLHSHAGIDAVTDRLRNAIQGITDWATGRQAVIDELAAIRAEILAGTFP